MPGIGIPKRQHESARRAAEGRCIHQAAPKRQSRAETVQTSVASDPASKVSIDEPSRTRFNKCQSPQSRSGFTHDIFQLTTKLKKPIAIVALGVLRIPLLATPVQSPVVDAGIDFADGPSGRSAHEKPSTELINKSLRDPKLEVLVPSSMVHPNAPAAKNSGGNSRELNQPVSADDVEPLVVPAFSERASSGDFELRENGRFSFVDPAPVIPSN
ncbi:MAG: hypothetical protein VYC39_15865 [Myxococcota bacterium]|nr:hypothetical protein [Myxococcota bacterium]